MSAETDIHVTKDKVFDPTFGLNSHMLGVIVAVIAVVITILLFVLWQRRQNARRGVLILGLCDAGKTLVFSRLLYNRHILTHTSIRENCGELIVNSGYLRVIDIPGHERVRFKFFDQYKSIARGIIFVVDATTIQKEIRDAAELLYTILTDAAIVSAATRVLVLCNKQDQTLAKGSQVVKSLLEKELNLLRSTKASQLSSTEGSTAQVTLGTPDKEFQFAQLAPISVEFAEGCAFNSTPETQAELKSVHKWVASIA
uniref:Signal recognition particle receptor subunit beta n=1 Tax=Cuerna arida TaxID=1464854 RepID=A0A1B6EHE8_9HEMI